MANEYIVINDDLRTMQIPSSIAILGVESDDDVNKIPFQMPKEYCGFDLSTFEARINYMNQAGIGDMYIVDDLAVDGDDPSLMTFTWLVGRNACAYKGNTQFIVCLKKFDDNDNVIQEFNTTVYSLPVLQGLETTEAIQQQNPDIIEEILQKINDAGIIDFSNYYTKAEVNALKLPNPNPLTINGTSYDGSAPVEMEIEGSSSQTTEIASGEIIHVTDAVANEAVKELTLYNASGGVINSANIAVANKNLFRLDQLAQQTVSKGVTFIKNADGSIHATGTSTGTYAAAQAAIDKNAFVVGETYTISSGKTSGVLYVQLILNYADGTTDYLVASNQPYTFTLQKEVSSVTGSVQITASGVTVDEWIYPMIELSDMASAFVMNSYSSMTYTGATMPVLPDSISNVWSNTDTVENIVMEYWNDPVMAKVNELEKQFNQTVEHDEELNATSERAVKNKTVTAALLTKISYPSSGGTGQHLTKTENGVQWSDAGTPTDTQATTAINAWLDEHPEATTTVEDGSITLTKLASDIHDDVASIPDLKNAIEQGGGGLNETVKSALLALLQNVVLTVDNGEQLFDNLYDALYPPVELVSISAVYTQSGTVYDNATLDSLRTDLVVTATYDDQSTAVITDYVLSGVLEAGTSTVTVTYSGKSTTFTVTVTALPASLSYMWDYTQSLTDVVGNKETVIYNGAYTDEDGLHLDDTNDYAVISNVLTPGTPQTVEIDIAEMTGENTSAQNRGLVYWGGSTTGLAYRNNNTWCLYAKSHGKDYNQWSGSISADATYFNNCTLKLTFDSERVIMAYKDGTYIKGNLDIGATDTSLQLGSATQNMYKITITGIRVYNEVI